MPPDTRELEEILGMGHARRMRGQRRAEAAEMMSRAAEGDHLPTTDQLLRGYPFLGGDMVLDIRSFVAAASSEALDREEFESLRRLTAATQGERLDGLSADAAILDALGACRFTETSDPEGSIRLRCVIYAAFLGDMEAALVVAAEAALMAYMQEWHREGDGSDAVWQALAWCALSASKMGPLRSPPHPVSEMASTRDRLDAFADEFRTRVFRLAREVD